MTKVAALHVYFKEFREPVKKSVENYTLGSDQTLLKQTWSKMAKKCGK